ncbi:MAG: CYTH domain-containing protein, partial [Gammaproteobacteria bacterium]|nr:CYTH domain-containing protein [Gammaproteobacteria bacterium]
MREIEAKFIIRRPEQVAEALRVLSANGFSVKDCGTKIHVDRYFDTEDWSILAAAWACRVRRRNGEAKLTLKSLHGPDGSVFVREEISQPVPDEDAELSFSLPLGQVRDELTGIVGNMPVAELFRVTSERTVYEIARTGPEPVQIEIDLDRSRIEAEKRTVKATGILDFTELELELVSGDTADLDTIATLLRDEAGLMAAKYSKFERGLQAAGLEIDSILEQPQATTLVADDPVLTLLYQYLAEQTQIIRRQYPRALEGIDPEGVHKMRVASRRLRTILKAFRDVLGDAVVAHFNAEL